MTRRALTSRKDRYFWSSIKLRKFFSNIDDSFNSTLHKWIISHTRVIWYPIEKYYIKVRLYDVNGGANTEIHQKFLL